MIIFVILKLNYRDMKKRLVFILIAILFLPVLLPAQEFDIKVKINGVQDTVIYLGHHYGDKKYVVDTTTIDAGGNAVFKGDKELHKGIYLVVMPSRGMTFFEILVTDNKSFSLETDTTDFVATMKIKGCRENRLFNEYQRKMGEMHVKRTELNEKTVAAEGDEAKLEILQEQALALNNERIEYIDNIIKKNPDFFFTKVLLAMKDIDIPDAPVDENGEIIDPDFQYHYFKEHYWDYLDFSEGGLLRTPIYQNKINYFLEKMVVPLPDSLMVEAERIINKAYVAGDSLVYRFTLSHLLRYFETSKVMGYDAVFVDIAENWYLNGKAPWADEEFLEKLRERVIKISPNLIGNISPNLMRMQTLDGKYISLHQVKADYTVLVFWEPDCGHCRKVVPALHQELQDTLKDLNVKVYACYTQYDKEEWEGFIEKNEIYDDNWYSVWDGPMPHSNFRNLYDIYSTPVVYLLAEDKRIVAKRINVEDIKKVIEHDKKRQENQK
jgi:thiol-disulfide isomerase/thioredoxin